MPKLTDPISMSLASVSNVVRALWISYVEWCRLWWRDIAIVAMLGTLSILLFRSHVFGDGLYIGNPDRLNSNLKILKFQLDGLANGHLDAWSGYEMLGYDTFTLPYTFPNAFTLLAYLLGPLKLYIVAGYEVVALLAFAGISAYAFLRSCTKSIFPATVAAILYEFSSLTLLKASQNDMSFAVFIIIPILMLVIRKADSINARRSFILLSALIFLLLHFMFLQKVSYALLFAGSYALYRSIASRDWRVIVIFAAACVVGIVGAFPRLYGIDLALNEYSRTVSGLDFNHFADVYRFQSIFPEQMLRWFDDTIFGSYPSDAAKVLRNNINLTEGFLLYTSSFVPFFMIFSLLRYANRPFGLVYSRRDDGGFFFWFLVFTFSVIAIPTMLEFIWLLYLRMDFTHARILIIGLLPLTVVVGLMLEAIRPTKEPSGPKAIFIWLISAALAVLAVFGVESLANTFPGHMQFEFADGPMQVRHSAIVRIAASAIGVGCLMLGIKKMIPGQTSLTRVAPFIGQGCLPVCLYYVLGLTMGIHTFVGADFQINDIHTRLPPPFSNGNIYYSVKTNFHPPGPDLIAKVRQHLDNDNYRVVLLCEPEVASGFCGGHIPEFWQLRAVDGYYGLGVPRRLAALPWRNGLSLRTISFTNQNDLFWPVLSLLNVKYAVKVSEALYHNNASGPDDQSSAISPDAIQVIENPLPAVPRYFFSRHIVPVQSAIEAGSKLFDGDHLIDVTDSSFVENFSGDRSYSGDGAIALAGSGDHLTIIVDPAPVERFLVLNELYFPGWSATIQGHTVPIYPTNAVMRGVVVPVGTTTIDFNYTPVTRSSKAFYFYLAGLILAGIGGVAFRTRPPGGDSICEDSSKCNISHKSKHIG